jgi:hypothetical protein
MYDAVADEYCYPGTTVLKNKLDLRDADELADFEVRRRRHSSIRFLCATPREKRTQTNRIEHRFRRSPIVNLTGECNNRKLYLLLSSHYSSAVSVRRVSHDPGWRICGVV